MSERISYVQELSLLRAQQLQANGEPDFRGFGFDEYTKRAVESMAHAYLAIAGLSETEVLDSLANVEQYAQELELIR